MKEDDETLDESHDTGDLDSFPYSGSDSLLGSLNFRLPDLEDRPSPLYECRGCRRLLETQEHRKLNVVPNYCPWCGRPTAPLLGREIDGYRVEAMIAEGGFGVVYLASNVAESKMKAVVKFLRPRMSYLRPELTRVFVEEARLAEDIGQTCWNVGRVWNVREKPFPYFFMEYIRGTTFDEVLRAGREKHTKISIEEAKGYLRGIAKALAATHARGRVHRDINRDYSQNS